MNILFSGIGGPTPLGLAQSVKDIWPHYKCIGVDASHWAPQLYQSPVYDKTFVIPNAQSEEYWLQMEELIKQHNIDFAFIVPETEALVWAKRASTHALPCKVHLPHVEMAEFCFDKAKVGSFLFDKGLTPRTVEVDTNSAMGNGSVGLDFPYWIRIKSGAGALGALKINGPKDLTTWLNIHSTRTDFMASEFLPGRNYACKMLYNHGELVQSASAERIDYLLSAAAPSGISGMCARGRLLNRPDLVEKSKIALENIANYLESDLHGMFTVDFKEDKNGIALITEINIRHVSFNRAFALGGVNFAKSTLRLYFEKGFKMAETNSFEEESYFIRGVDAPIRLIRKESLKSTIHFKTNV